MAWIDVQKKGSKEIHRVTEEAFELNLKEQGFEIVNKAENKASTAQKEIVRENVQPKAELPSKRQYNKRTSVSNDN